LRELIHDFDDVLEVLGKALVVGHAAEAIAGVIQRNDSEGFGELADYVAKHTGRRRKARNSSSTGEAFAPASR
jgi:hypothetical protein